MSDVLENKLLTPGSLLLIVLFSKTTFLYINACQVVYKYNKFLKIRLNDYIVYKLYPNLGMLCLSTIVPFSL